MRFVILGGGADGVVFGCLTPEGEVRLPSISPDFNFLNTKCVHECDNFVMTFISL
jgi:hypothetical protein